VSANDSTLRRAARELLAAAGSDGLTYEEYGERTGRHHGQASGMLSGLHSRGEVMRLTERRNRCAVYVLPEFAEGRETRPYGQRSSKPNAVEVEAGGLRDALTEAADQILELRDLVTAAEAREKQARKDADTEVRLAHLAKEDAVAKAEDKAWTAGYDEGVSAGRREGVSRGGEGADALIREGFDRGRIAEMKHIDRLAYELAANITRSIPIRTHHQTCYMQHPECAVKAIRRNIAVRLPTMEALPNANHAGLDEEHELDLTAKQRAARAARAATANKAARPKRLGA
jgi:hypothetical protein